MTDNKDAKATPEATPFPSFASLKTTHSELLEREPESDDDAQYYGAVEQFFSNARATGELLSDEEERRSAQSILNYWLTVLYRADRKPQNINLAQLKADLRPNLKDAVCPYPGPYAFTEDEYKYFFGRYRQIEYMLARFKVESFLVLLSPSGTGKTSLVQAGLIPALRRLDREDEPDEGPMYFFPVITPGKNPLRNLANALKQTNLAPEVDAPKLYEKMRATPGYLKEIIREHLKTPVVIVVDQFEETFTLCRDQHLRKAFVETLMELNDGRNKIILCATDGDYNRELNKLPALDEHFKRASTILPKLGLSELTDAIVKPADIVGLKFKEETVKNIVQEIASQPVGLPLLQFTLLKLWDKRVGDETPDEFFKRMKTCRQILSQSAQSLYEGFNAGQQESARQVLSRLIKFDKSGAHTQIVLRDSLAEIDGGSKIVEAMEREHLVRLTKSAQAADVQVEIVHDSLLSEWPVTWEILKEKERRNKTHWMIRTLSLLGIIVGISVLFYFLIEARVARAQRAERKKAAVIEWAAESGKELADIDSRIDLALMLALASYETDKYSPNAQGAMLDILHYSPRPKAFIKPETAMDGDVALNPDGQVLAANDVDGSITIWDLTPPHHELHRMADPDARVAVKEGEDPPITPLIFSADGRLLASGTYFGPEAERIAAVAVWDVASGARLATLIAKDKSAATLKAKDKKTTISDDKESADRITTIAFAPDGQSLAAGSVQGLTYRWETVDSSWDKANGSAALVLHEDKKTTKYSIKDSDSVQYSITDLRFSPDGNWIASGNTYGTVMIWEARSGRLHRALTYDCDCLKKKTGQQKQITGLAFAQQGSNLFVGSTEDVILYDADGGQAISVLNSDLNGVGMYLALSDDGKILQGFDWQGGRYLWDVKGESIETVGKKTLFRPFVASRSFAFSRDGNTIALGGENGFSAWNLAWQRPMLDHDDEVNGLAFSPNGRLLASADEGGTVTLRDAASHKLLRQLSNVGGSAAFGVAFSHSGQLLATQSFTGSVTLWKLLDEQNESVLMEVPAELNEFGGLERSVIVFTQDDKKIITLSTYDDNGEEKVYLSTWDVGEQKLLNAPIKLPLDKAQKVTSATFSNDGQVLALATETEEGSGSSVNFLGTVKGNTEIAVTLWNVTDGKRFDSLPTHFKSTVKSLALNADGTWVAAGEDEESRVVLWNRQRDSKTVVMPFEGHSGSISHLAFNNDGTALSMSIDQGDGNGDGESGLGESHKIFIWDIRLNTLGKLITSISSKQTSSPIILSQRGGDLSEHESSTKALAISPDGKQLAMADANHSLMIWDIVVSDAKKFICGITNRKFTGEEVERYKLERYNAGFDPLNPCQ